MSVYGVIIAGGQGKRLWPLSRISKPKPTLAIGRDKPLIRQVMERLENVTERKNVFVVTNEEVFAPIYDAVKELSVVNVITEPISRNTAAAIGLAAIHITEREQNPVMIVMPADHYIEDDNKLSLLLKAAIDACEKINGVVIFGVKPASPSTNYGYIEKGETSSLKDTPGLYRVRRFTEKPDMQLAEQFIKEGYLWNAGIFVAKADIMLAAIKKYMPELSDALNRIKKQLKGPYERKTIKEEYIKLQDLSIDKGIIEKLDNVYVIEMNTGWADLGSFEQLAGIAIKQDEKGNRRIGNGIDIGSSNNIVMNEYGFVVTANISDIIVIASSGVVLVTKKGSDETISKIVNILREKNLKEYL
ncbi:MAG: mannose-1-phosphate guanylyltransferase [Deltaproteobacteria bacterium]|nr:mannose-1-phosphate guanylyltransferase [Deltaproteobacteria bacterium]MCL5792011.1 mannose-1-phosphate guanylyltransferase [Deltaproteobacteria bacterium]